MTDASLAAATVESLFADAGALLDGHFLLKSGRHAGRYLEKFLVLQHPRYGVELSRRLAEALTPYRPDAGGRVRRPAACCSPSRRRASSEATSARPSPSRSQAGGRALRRGWSVAADERVAIVDDILTTGASLLETVEAVRAAGVEPVAAAVLVDRSTEPSRARLPAARARPDRDPVVAAGRLPAVRRRACRSASPGAASAVSPWRRR